MTGAGDSKILVKDHHVLEPKLPSSILKCVLAATTLLITRDLAQGRLADINMSGSFKCFAVMLSLIGAWFWGFALRTTAWSNSCARHSTVALGTSNSGTDKLIKLWTPL
jgi:hypothetical protein